MKRCRTTIFNLILPTTVFSIFISFCISLAQLNQNSNTPIMEEQPFNLIYTFEFEEGGIPRISSITEIPLENFRFGLIPKKQQDDVVQQKEPQHIHTILKEWAELLDPSTTIEVIVSFREDQKIPRLPRLARGHSRTSSTNQTLLRRRHALIEDLHKRRIASQAKLTQQLHSYGLEILEQHWLTNSLLARLPAGSIKAVVEQPEVLYIQPRFGGESPPNHDNNPNNDVVEARRQIQSDPYFDEATSSTSVAVLDTGVRRSHVLFQEPSGLGIPRDCVNGGPQCETVSDEYNPSDLCDHGTSTIGIITGNSNLNGDFRGVSADVVYSLKVYTERHWRRRIRCKADMEAVVRGFQVALGLGADVIVAEVQAREESETGVIAISADNAYDMGAAIIAANGNCALSETCRIVPGEPREETVRSPAVAHKAIGVGVYDVESGKNQDYQSRGPAPDRRIKPDIQAPTNTETASSDSDEALHIFHGTSGSTPYTGAAAALILDWLLDSDANFDPGPFDPGQVYAWLIASGQNIFFNNVDGVGHLKLLIGGFVQIGKTLISEDEAVDIPFTVNPDDRRIDAAIWWPESASQQHNDIDIRIFDPAGVERAFSLSIPSVFERARVDGTPLITGDWRLRIEGFSVPTGPQSVYFVVHHTPFIPKDDWGVAQLDLHFEPNPVPQSSSSCLDVIPAWFFTVLLEEIAGIGVNITKVTTDFFDSNGIYINTQVLDVDFIIPQFTLVQIPFCAHLGGRDSGSIVQNFEGADDNGNIISVSGSVILLDSSFASDLVFETDRVFTEPKIIPQ